MENVLLDFFTESGAAGIVGGLFYLLIRNLLAKHEIELARHEREMKECRDHFSKQEERWNDRLDDCVSDKVNYLKQLNERERNG